MAAAARFDNSATQLAVCRGVRVFWVLLVAVNAAGAVHEALTGETIGPVLHLMVIAGMVGAYVKALRPMIDEARLVAREQEAETRRARIADLERELGMR